MLVVRLGLDVRLGVDRGGELTQNGMLENHPRGQRYPAISSPGSHLSREDAVAAEVCQMLAGSGFVGHVVLEVSTSSARSANERESMLAESLQFARTHLLR